MATVSLLMGYSPVLSKCSSIYYATISNKLVSNSKESTTALAPLKLFIV